VLELLDPVSGELVFYYGGSVEGSIVPMEEPFLLNHHRPFLLQMFQEFVKGHHHVIGIDSGAPVYDVGVDEAFAVEKSQYYLFSLTCMDSGLERAWLAFLDPLLGLFLISGVWWNIIVLSIVTMLPSIQCCQLISKLFCQISQKVWPLVKKIRPLRIFTD
jgi:hypothetical protein